MHCNGLFCAFDGSFSYDPDGIAVYTWSFGDGTSSFGSYTARRYVSAGTYPVTLSVRDNTGAIATKTTMVTVTNSRPTAAVQFSCDSLVCNFSGQGSLDLDGTIVSYAWTLGDGTQASGASAIHVFAGPGTYSVRLTVTDNMGDSGTADASVTVAQRFTHIGDLDAATNVQKRSWDAFVTLAIHDGAHQPAAYASVTGVWSNGSTASCTADHLGVCTVARHGLPNSTPSTTFTVQSVVSGAAIYSAAANHDSDGETNGTSVIVRKR